MARRTVAFHVEFELPPGATVRGAVDYIESALQTECGMRPPEDPMREFNRLSVEVRSDRLPLAE